MVIALTLVNIVPSWDIEGRDYNTSAITVLLYSYKYSSLVLLLNSYSIFLFNLTLLIALSVTVKN